MKKILLAYDGSDEANVALERTAELARGLDAEVGVVSVVPFRPGRGGGIAPWDDQSVHDEQLAAARSALGALGIDPALHRPAGDPAREVDRVARDFGYDTIVLGTRDLNPLERLLEGSVAAGVARRATATVIIARE